MSELDLCDDCPPPDYPTDKTRCLPCPRRGDELEAPRRPRRGRPPDDGRDAKCTYVGFRAPLALKSQLEAAALVNGRSLSYEAQIRLEQSFREETLIAELEARGYRVERAA